MGVAIDLDTPSRRLPVASKQLVAIARALANDARIIVMDEPTTALTGKEVGHLLRLVSTLRSQGRLLRLRQPQDRGNLHHLR